MRAAQVVELLLLNRLYYMTTYPGDPYPLGSFWDGKGVNFAVYSHNATGVELCLFHTDKGEKEFERITFTERSHDVWHGYIPGPETRAALRLSGLWAL
jgi:isoamylase